MRISELIKHLEKVRSMHGNVFIEGNRHLTISAEDFSYIDRHGNDGAEVAPVACPCHKDWPKGFSTGFHQDHADACPRFGVGPVAAMRIFQA